MNVEDRTEFWDLIGAIATDLDDIDWDIIKYIGQAYRQVEIAELLGIHRNSVKNRLNRIKKLIEDKKT